MSRGVLARELAPLVVAMRRFIRRRQSARLAHPAVEASVRGSSPPEGAAPASAGGTSWRVRFGAELQRIAAVEHGGPAPRVLESLRVPNVGANAEVVVVNPRWMDRVSRQICRGSVACCDDLVRGIAGHEWGHVQEARCPPRVPRDVHDRELQADRTAGRLLAQAGASAAPLLRLLDTDAAAPSPTHPAGAERVDAVLAGARLGSGCRETGACTCAGQVERGSTPAPPPALCHLTATHDAPA